MASALPMPLAPSDDDAAPGVPVAGWLAVRSGVPGDADILNWDWPEAAYDAVVGIFISLPRLQASHGNWRG